MRLLTSKSKFNSLYEAKIIYCISKRQMPVRGISVVTGISLSATEHTLKRLKPYVRRIKFNAERDAEFQYHHNPPIFAYTLNAVGKKLLMDELSGS